VVFKTRQKPVKQKGEKDEGGRAKGPSGKRRREQTPPVPKKNKTKSNNNTHESKTGKKEGRGGGERSDR
jgi:hypothetical protein